MERAEPLLPALGLRPEDAPQLRAAAREFLESVGPLFKRTWDETDAAIEARTADRTADRNATSGVGHEPTDFANDAWTTYRKTEERCARHALAAIRKSVGSEGAGRVENLAREFDFTVDDRAEWQWLTLFGVIARKKTADLADELAWPPARVSDVRRILRNEIRQDVERKIASAMRRSPSAWERRLERDLYILDPPLEMLRSRIKVLYVREAWRRLQLMLSAEEISALLEWASQEAPRHTAVFATGDQVLLVPT